MGPWGLGWQKEDRKDELMDYVELFLLSMRAVTGLKIISDTIAWQREHNYDGSAFCVTLGPIWVGSEALFLMELASEPSKMKIVLGDEVRGKVADLILMTSGLSRIIDDAF